MTDFVSGISVSEIKNKEFLRFETTSAKEICIALDKSDIPFSARYDGKILVLTYDGSYQEQVKNIVSKANSGDYEVILRELKTYGVPDGYLRLLAEVAELLNTSVGALKNRPDDVQLALCKTYVDFWLCDTAVIQRELDRIITVNGRTLSDIQEHEKTEIQAKAPKNTEPSVPILEELFASYNRRNSHAHFTREAHRHLAEIAQRRQCDEQERIEAEEIERKRS